VYRIELKDYSRLRRRARASARNLREIGGVILGRGLLLRLLPCRNYSRMHLSFRYSSLDVSRLRTSMRGERFSFRGFYHSHPISEGRPSRNDRRYFKNSKLMMIYDVVRGSGHIFKLGTGRGRRSIAEVPFWVLTGDQDFDKILRGKFMLNSVRATARRVFAFCKSIGRYVSGREGGARMTRLGRGIERDDELLNHWFREIDQRSGRSGGRQWEMMHRLREVYEGATNYFWYVHTPSDV